jgi:ribosome biogenesis GTPase
MRELGLWEEGNGLDSTFADIAELVQQCRFLDCRHEHEPGCAIKLAIEEGRLDAHRYENYTKLQREMTYLENRKDVRAQREIKEKWKKIHKSMRKHYKQKGW